MGKESRLGRPRAFDREQALDAAVRVFWARGYEGASLAELTSKMGINKPSLYAAFGDKRALFNQALDRYALTVTSFFEPALAKSTARETVEALLVGAARVATHAEGPGGCLFTHAALACNPATAEVKQAVAARRLQGEKLLVKRFRQARKTGELAADADCSMLAKYVAALAQGFAVQGSAGASGRDLQRVIDLTLSTGMFDDRRVKSR